MRPSWTRPPSHGTLDATVQERHLCDNDRQSPKSHGTPSAVRSALFEIRPGAAPRVSPTVRLRLSPLSARGASLPLFLECSLTEAPSQDSLRGLGQSATTSNNRQCAGPFVPRPARPGARCSRRSKPPSVLVWWRRGRHPSQLSTPKSRGACNWHHCHSRSLNLEPSRSHGLELAVLLPAHISLLGS
jgi:hypothetical protein